MINLFYKEQSDSHGITNNFIHKYLRKRIHCIKIFTEQKYKNVSLLVLVGSISLIITLNDIKITARSQANSFLEHGWKMLNKKIANQIQQHIKMMIIVSFLKACKVGLPYENQNVIYHGKYYDYLKRCSKSTL